jgi:hypothetical protein
LKLNRQGPNELSDYIRKAKPVPPDQPVVITPALKDRPIWIELPLVTRGADPAGDEGRLQPGSFGRVLYLTSEKEAKPEEFRKLLAEFPQAHRIVVYEFENATRTVRNAVPYKRTPTQKERTLANGSPMVVWSIHLSKLAAEEPKPRGDK